MVSETVVRNFFAVSGLDSSYFTVAQHVLDDFAETAHAREPTSEQRERLGKAYVDFMVGIYAEMFDDEEMAELILHFQRPAFRKLVAADSKAGSRIEKFLHREVEKILGIKIVEKTARETKAVSRMTH